MSNSAPLSHPAPAAADAPHVSSDERARRVDMLSKCFRMMDVNGDGMIVGSELEAFARAFNPSRTQAELAQEVATVLAKLDANLDGVVDEDEWTSALLVMFQFMGWDAFVKHCQELESVVTAARASM